MRKNCNILIPFALLLLVTSCITLSVYVPHRGVTPEKRTEKTPHIPQINVSDPVQEASVETYFAKRSPCLFFMADRNIQNRHGIFAQLIRDELDNYYSLYFPSTVDYSAIDIVVEKFSLFSNDRCFKNVTNIDVVIKVSGVVKGQKKEIMKYVYNDMINSRVTELYLMSIVGIIPVIFHSGFRGNRKDQMDHLGRLALLGFFEQLRDTLKGMNNSGQETGQF